MKDLTLMILAAGMGSRFGGLKQLTPVGSHGESILDYSVYDAIEAGFDRVVFIIKHAIEEEFYEKVGKKIENHVKVDYVFQEIDDMPSSLTPPEGRTKPWGTGHAVWCALKQAEIGSFAVINADDYYGKEGFRQLAGFLRNPPSTDGIPMAMAGYRLKNTLSDNGYVSRGVCVVNEASKLLSITERTRIERRDGVPAFSEDEGASWTTLDEDTFVSMNCWAFPAEVKPVFNDMMADFFKENATELKKEFYLPLIPDRLVQSGEGQVYVLPTEDKWYGMTYAEDKKEVIDALAALTAKGLYPDGLWK